MCLVSRIYEGGCVQNDVLFLVGGWWLESIDVVGLTSFYLMLCEINNFVNNKKQHVQM